MPLLDLLKRRKVERAASDEDQYWELVEKLAAGDDDKAGAKDAAAAERLLEATGRAVHELESHVALVRERGSVAPLAEDAGGRHADLKKAMRALADHDDERRQWLVTWEKAHAELNGARGRAKTAVEKAHAAKSRLRAIDEELAAARRSIGVPAPATPPPTGPTLAVVGDSPAELRQLADAELRDAEQSLHESQQELERLKARPATDERIRREDEAKIDQAIRRAQDRAERARNTLTQVDADLAQEAER